MDLGVLSGAGDRLQAGSMVTVFIYGGCPVSNPGPGGWAFLWRLGQECGERSGTAPLATTNNAMELVAAIEAVKLLGSTSTQIEVFSDARYVTDGISEWLPNWKKRGWRTTAGKPIANIELWREMDDLLRGKNIRWSWIRQGSTADHAHLIRLVARAVEARLAAESRGRSIGTAHASHLWRPASASAA